MPYTHKKINFFITSDTFPSISITGTSCSLSCKHCSGKLLERLIPAMTCEELLKIGMKLDGAGAKGMLLTGGCDEHGCVPVKDMIPAIRKLKEKTDLIIIAHTGFISPEDALALHVSGIDGIGFDVMGDMAAVREIYGMESNEKDYLDSLHAISDSGIMIFPHVCVGIYFGELRGEFKALEMIRTIKPSSIIITGLMPIAGTPMAHIKPAPGIFDEVIKKAIEMFPDTQVILGCAHSSGKERGEIELLALRCGVSGIASPTLKTVNYAKMNGYEINYYGTCCGIMPDESVT